MKKNIIIIGAARSGKTTLSKKLAKEQGYSIISIDDLVSGFEAFPELNIKHDSNDVETSHNLAPFLIRLLSELSEGNKFYDGIKYVIEGTHIDFEQLMPFLQSDEYREKYEIIGLTYNDITPDKMYADIRSYDTEDDWTYWKNEEELKGDVKYFIERNKFFQEQFEKYNIKSYDVSYYREVVLDGIVASIKDNQIKK